MLLLYKSTARHKYHDAIERNGDHINALFSSSLAEIILGIFPEIIVSPLRKLKSPQETTSTLPKVKIRIISTVQRPIPLITVKREIISSFFIERSSFATGKLPSKAFSDKSLKAFILFFEIPAYRNSSSSALIISSGVKFLLENTLQSRP